MTELQILIDEHDELIRRYRTALTDFPGDIALKGPFHPSSRAHFGETPRPAQAFLADFLCRLGDTTKRLRNYFICIGDEGTLKHFPFAPFGQVANSYGPSVNFGKNYSDEGMLADLEREKELLRQLLVSQPSSSEPPTPTEVEIRHPSPQEWRTGGWSKRLKEARIGHGHSQKDAAKCCCVALDTYKPWEQGRRPPGSGNMLNAVKYLRTAPKRPST